MRPNSDTGIRRISALRFRLPFEEGRERPLRGAIWAPSAGDRIQTPDWSFPHYSIIGSVSRNVANPQSITSEKSGLSIVIAGKIDWSWTCGDRSLPAVRYAKDAVHHFPITPHNCRSGPFATRALHIIEFGRRRTGPVA